MSSPDSVVVACDLGTTTIAASLVEMGTGRRLAEVSGPNPQRQFGADVVTRLDAALKSPVALREMSSLVNRALASYVAELLATAGRRGEELGGLAVAGNPSMEHLLLGLPVESLAFPPYRPLFSQGRTVDARELGWDLALPVHLFPLPGGFVGGDLVAFLYGRERAAPAGSEEEIRLFLDLGTNAEMALAIGGRIFATSAAAGPALEGGNLTCGMVAGKGAIQSCGIDADRVALEVIGGGAPLGICGSAVLDVVAELLRHGVVDATGRLLSPAEIPSNLANRVEEQGGELVFVLFRGAQELVYLSQSDIRQVQLAKAAIRAGLEVLFQRAGLAGELPTEVVVTGSFGAVLRPDSLKMVGVFTENMVQNASFVREGALAGVEEAASVPGGYARVDQLAANIRVIPLSGTPAFEKHFLEQMNFPGLKR